MIRYRTSGQALVLVALTLGILVTLIVGVNEVSLRRRTMSRIQHSLDSAGLAALHEMDPASLLSDTPQFTSQAQETFRTTLTAQLARVASALTEEPVTVANRTSVQLVASGGHCAGQVVQIPTVCAELHATIAGGIGRYPITMTSMTQWQEVP
jgi:hypothetical protein